MAKLIIDRSDLPKPWANPLVFVLSDGEQSIEAEVRQDAAIEYQSAWRAGGIALALAPQRTEYFVQSLEDAVDRMVSDDPTSLPNRLLIGWDDLKPE